MVCVTDILSHSHAPNIIFSILDDRDFHYCDSGWRNVVQPIVLSYTSIKGQLEVATIFNAQESTLIQVFPLTLEEINKRWFERTSTDCTKSWNDLKQNFIQRFCPPSMIFQQLSEIRNFKQEEGKSLFDTWERYNELLFKCHFQDLNDHQKVNTFYNGLNSQTRRTVDSNGLIPGLTASDALKSI
ncbi:hypothetical protein Tco_1260276 [Tanacetum coccineum]